MATEVKRLTETKTGRDGGGFVFVLNESLAAMFDFLPNSAEQLQGWKSLHLAGGPALNTKSCSLQILHLPLVLAGFGWRTNGRLVPTC